MRRRSPLVSIFLIVLVDILGMTIILPLLPFYAESLGATPLIVGLLLSTYAACQLIAGPILGQISDRIGRKPVLLLSQCGTFAGFLLLAASQSLLPVFLARVIDGLTAGNISVAQAYIADVTEEEKRTQSFALIGIAFGIGFLLGPAVSGFLAQFSYRYPIYLAAGLSATSIGATFFLLPGGHGHQKQESLGWSKTWRVFWEPAMSRLFLQFTSYAFTFSLLITGFALFAERRFTYGGVPFQAKHVGYVLAFLGLVGIVIQGGLIRHLVRRIGEARLIVAGFASLVIGMIAVGLVYRLDELVVVMVILSFGSSVVRPALTTLITQVAGRQRQGTALGLMQSLNSIAQIVSPTIGGALIQHGLLASWAFVAAIFAAIGLLLSQPARMPSTLASEDLTSM
jgi:DHA1 family tetracycline resistance protein-like MFS transporter